MESHYEALGLPPTADEREVRRAYRALLKEHHPDQGGSRERFLRIREAYEQIVGERPPEKAETDGGPGLWRERSRSADQVTYEPDERTPPLENGHEALTVAGDYLSLTLSALVHDVPLEKLIDDDVTASTRRTVAFFRARNTSSREISWQGKANTNFIGDDGFLYQGSSIVTPHAENLPERWCGTDVDVPPERAVDAIVIAQEIPEDVTVEKVLYTQHVSGPDGSIEDTERYLFELRPLVRERLNRLPF